MDTTVQPTPDQPTTWRQFADLLVEVGDGIRDLPDRPGWPAIYLTIMAGTADPDATNADAVNAVAEALGLAAADKVSGKSILRYAERDHKIGQYGRRGPGGRLYLSIQSTIGMVTTGTEAVDQ